MHEVNKKEVILIFVPCKKPFVKKIACRFFLSVYPLIRRYNNCMDGKHEALCVRYCEII